VLNNNAGTEAKKWYVIRAKPKKERSSAALLARAGIEVYLPELSIQKSCNQPAHIETLFPGYFFSKFNSFDSDLRLIRYTPGVAYVLGYDNHPYPLSESFIQTIRKRLAQGQGMMTSEFSQGDTVVITSGPLRDMEAVFDCHLSGTGRARVLIKVLNRLWRAETHIDHLRRRVKAVSPVHA
jgi:transcription elongation factor/antiterminator RfaH